MHFSRKHFWIFRAALLALALTSGWRLEAAIYDPDIPAALRTINCANQPAFTTALAGAIPGDHIILADGTYTFGTLTKNGTATNPIVIEALNNAGAIINSTNTQHILNSSYVILNGLMFTASGGSQQMFEINDSRYIRVTRCSFDGSGLGDAVAVVDNTASSSTASHHNRYDHCRWYGKTNTGEYLKWSQTGSSNAISTYDRIDHNFFDGRLPANNGSESTRMGVGLLSLIPSFMVCEYNLYTECDGDSEVVSVKTSCAIVRYNTFINCAGTGASLRQGTNNEVYNNIVLTGSQAGNGGIKITGFYHSVHDNYIEGGVENLGIGALVLQGGNINSVDSEGGHGIIDTLVLTNNVLYNNKYGLEVGCKYTPYMPRNCIIANNKVQQSSGPCYNITGEGTNNIWFGNTARITGTATAGSANGVSVTTTNIDYAYYRSLALTTNDVGPNAVDLNYAPSVSLTAPTNSASFTAPASIAMTATASDTDGTVTNVSFYNGATLLGTDTTAPYAYTWTNVAASSYSLTVRATDNDGAVSTSAVVAVTVLDPTYILTVNSGAGGGSYTNTQVVAISANAPAAGKAFVQWIGDTQYVNNVTYTNALVTMSTNAVSLTATYVDLYYALTVNRGTGSGSYTNATKVAIAANAPATGKAFSQWTGNTAYVADSNSANTTVTMPAQAVTLTATYLDLYYALTVTGGSGSGSYTNGRQVAISADAPITGKAFSQWVGDTQYVASASSASTMVTMSTNTVSLTATYVDVYYSLTVNSGTGGGSYTNGRQVAISADAPITGKAFSQWVGDTQYVNNVTYTNALVTMSTNAVSLSATYADIYYTLTVNSGTGGGSYTNTQTVAISANAPATGTAFDKWTGSTQYVNNVTYTNALVTMPAQDAVLTATYKNLPGYYTLTVSNGIGGGAYTNGTQVAITAVAPDGTAFDQWTGDTQVVAGVFSFNTTVTMPAQNTALSASCVDASNGVVNINWALFPFAYYEPSFEPLLGPAGFGKSTIAQLMYSPDEIKDGILPSGAGAENDVVWDTITLTENGDGVIEWGIFSANTVRTWTNGYVYALIFQDNHVQPGDWYLSGPMLALENNVVQSINVCTDESNGDAVNGANGAQVMGISISYTLTVNNGSGGGSYTNGQQVAISANAPVSGKVFDKWTGDTQYLAGATVTMPAQAISLTATYKDIAYTLTVNSGSGSGSYTNGQQVAVSANAPAAGMTFDKWTGDTQVVNNVTYTNALVTMPAQASALSATYKILPGLHTLTVSNGTGSGIYSNGAQVTITAIPPGGTAFARWTGDTQVVAGVFSLRTIMTMPAQDAALIATCVSTSNGVVNVDWSAVMGFYFSAGPNTGILGPVGSGKATIAQLMYSPDNAKDSIRPSRAGAVNDVVWDTIALTEAGGETQWAVFADSTKRAWTNGYVYALIFQDNNVQPGDWYFSTPLLPLVMATNIFPQSIEMNTDFVNGNAIDGVDGAQVMGSSVSYTLTVNGGTGGGSYTNGRQVAISADAPAAGKVFSQWIGDIQYVNNITYTNALVTMSTNAVTLTATYSNLYYTLTATAGAGGTVSPTIAILSIGDSTNIVITASNYYRIATLTTNGANVAGMTFGNNSTTTNFTWSNVQTSGVLAATFAAQVVTNAPAQVPYSWLAQYGLTNYNTDAAADQDQDGLTTWQEYISGTVPTNGTSCFKAAQNTRNVISWSSVSGRVYSVYWSTNLVKGFQALETNIPYPQSSFTNATPDGRVNQYQIKVRLQ